ncbi:YebC/PmpR family DNA-binding transcriptional regulator [Patescibacteria group bacterium]|nr:YebC/PmpR family DNA-binding transcriptional regulator [Patescibacteria group bacterium]
MSGHSKWANIKRQKGVNDAKKARVFTKIARAIAVSAQKGGGDPDSNPNLRLAIEKAHSANMPKENITRAIAKGSGTGLGAQRLEEIRYEGYGPGGVAILVDVLTDNRNRTTAEIRNIFSKLGGSLGEVGSALYVFGKDPENPTFTVPLEEKLKNKVLELLETLDDQDDTQEVYSNGEL